MNETFRFTMSTEVDNPPDVLSTNVVSKRQGFEMSFWVGPLEKENRVSQFGKLVNLNLQSKGRRHTFMPYGLSQFQKDKEWEGNAGIDFRYRLTSNLGADLTINPDFATMEADVEQINLTHFELRIPEKLFSLLEGVLCGEPHACEERIQ